MSFLDLDERLIDLASLVEICYSPIADVKNFPQAVDITLVEGAVANEDHVRDLRLIRARTKTLIAFGDCAITGNVTAMRNLFSIEDALQRAYRDAAVVSGVPTGNGIVPKLLDRVLRVQDLVKVDYFLPGCPPSAGVIHGFLADLLAGREPSPEGRRFGT
jgi:NAD-reducing hydrogenase small subunit